MIRSPSGWSSESRSMAAASAPVSSSASGICCAERFRAIPMIPHMKAESTACDADADFGPRKCGAALSSLEVVSEAASVFAPAATSSAAASSRVGDVGGLDHHPNQGLGARRTHQHPAGVAQARLDLGRIAGRRAPRRSPGSTRRPDVVAGPAAAGSSTVSELRQGAAAAATRSASMQRR